MTQHVREAGMVGTAYNSGGRGRCCVGTCVDRIWPLHTRPVDLRGSRMAFTIMNQRGRFGFGALSASVTYGYARYDRGTWCRECVRSHPNDSGDQ